MLLSIKSGALICFASVILGAALITARTHYSENENGFYKASDGNYYAYSRQGSDQLPEEEPSFFGWIIQGIKRMLGIAPATDPRQGQSFLGSLLSSGGWILPATGVAVAGVYREEISDIIEELVDPSTAKPNETTTAKPDPCTGVTCASDKVAVSALGICQCLECGSDSDCTAVTTANRCVSGQCECGSTAGKCTTASGKPVCTNSAAFTTAATAADGTSAVCSCKADSCLPSVVTDGTVSKCDTSDGQCKCGAANNAACTSGSTIPKCMVTSTGVAPTAEANTANCQCTATSLAADTCAQSGNTGYVAKMPTCSTTDMDTVLTTAQTAVGVCQVCNKCTAGSGNNGCVTSSYLVGTGVSGAAPSGANLESTCNAHDTHGCCANGACAATSGTCPA